eukprot:gnl/TRDRNA2_/TRDRNA2_165483_c2_seq4.p2 gnl/TRDRNA2_/TRDRNA2_165483_c2~~gnl/TRDRNA2_/TRDRNA2_165483_c2_seq4.p2  ORF type:complete len:170 (+),score=25.73 gnl/TRDRNA2_/TRDRNA2_165483_c2_seq4:549-1058(+)
MPSDYEGGPSVAHPVRTVPMAAVGDLGHHPAPTRNMAPDGAAATHLPMSPRGAVDNSASWRQESTMLLRRLREQQLMQLMSQQQGQLPPEAEMPEVAWAAGGPPPMGGPPPTGLASRRKPQQQDARQQEHHDATQSNHGQDAGSAAPVLPLPTNLMRPPASPSNDRRLQ